MAAVLLLLCTHLAVFVLGCLAGRFLSFKTATAVTHHQETHVTSDRAPSKRRSFWSRIDGGVITYVVVGIALILAGVSYAQTQTQESAANQRYAAQTKCLNAYANQLASAIEARQEATEARQQAETVVFDTTLRLVNHQATQADFQTALEGYRDADQELVNARKTKPYPAAPRQVCEQ